jgi:hypothetical protein
MKILSVVVVLAVVTAFFATAQVARAETAAAPVKLSQTAISVGNPALGRVNIHEKFALVESVCFDFVFVNDLLDPGELLLIRPLAMPSVGFGFVNLGLTSQAERTVCVIAPDLVALFADGKEKGLEISMRRGSVEIASLVVTVTGTLR